MVGLIPILLIVVIFVLGNYALNPKSQKSAFTISRSTHYKLLVFFVAFLITATVFAGILDSKINSATPPEKVESNHYNEEYNSIDNQIVNKGAVDPAFLLEKRTHPAGKTLKIQWELNPYEGNSPFIYIERKQPGDQTIEEFLYKPLLIVDNYDFSNAIDVTKPMWTENTMIIPKTPMNETTLATFFYDASLLQQLTKNRQLQSNGYSSEYRSLIIHLKIPADLEIVGTDVDFLYFVD